MLSSSVPRSPSASRPDLPQHQPLAWIHTVDNTDRTPAILKHATPSFLCKILDSSLFPSPAEQLRYGEKLAGLPRVIRQTLSQLKSPATDCNNDRCNLAASPSSSGDRR